MVDEMHSEVMTLKATLDRAQEEGIQVSRYFVVSAIESGDIAARKVGRSYILPWDSFVTWALGTEHYRAKRVPQKKVRKVRFYKKID